MSRIVYGLVIGLALATLVGTKAQLDKAAFRENSSVKPDGVYEFVSESVLLTRPTQAESVRLSSEWGGQWQFLDGRYSRVLMKWKRESFFNSNRMEDLGFEASAGSYEIRDQSLILTQAYALHPFEVGKSLVVGYKVDGDYLTLTEKLYSHLEDLREGTVTTILRRVR